MSKKFFLLLFFLGYAALSFFISQNYFFRRELAKIKNESYFVSKKNEFFEMIIQQQEKYCGMIFPFHELYSLPLVGDNSEKEIEIFNQIKYKDYTIILFFSDVDCGLCIDKSLDFFKNLFSRNDNSFVIISIVYSPKDFYYTRFKRLNKIDFPMFKDLNKKIHSILNINKGPVIFLVNNRTKQIVMVYHPTPYFDNLNNRFFKIIFQIIER